MNTQNKTIIDMDSQLLDLSVALQNYRSNPIKLTYIFNLFEAFRAMQAHKTCELFVSSLVRAHGTSRSLAPLHVMTLLDQGRFGDAVVAAASHLPLPGLPDAPEPLLAPTQPTPTKQPSAAFQSLVEIYAAMHAASNPDQDLYAGWLGLAAHGAALRRMAAQLDVKSALDYGGGKGQGWRAGPIDVTESERYPRFLEYVGLDAVDIYDPGAGSTAQPIPGGWDAALCFDVLEHIPEDDIDWVLEEIFAAARKLVMINVALYPAARILSDGRNAHITLRQPDWWSERLQRTAERHPHLRAVCYFSALPLMVQAAWRR